MATIDIDIDIEDYINEISTHSLISELASRKNVVTDFRRIGIDILKEIDDDEIIADLKERYDTLSLIKKVLDIRSWHDKKRIIQEIESL